MQLPKGKRARVSTNRKFDGACYYCGLAGHKKTQCRKLKADQADKVSAVCDFAFPVGSFDTGPTPTADRVMLSVGSRSMGTFMIDGGSTCHVLGFMDAAASLFNMRRVDITTKWWIFVYALLPPGRWPERWVLSGMYAWSLVLANLVSGPRLEGEGYALHQENGVYTARKNGDLVFQALKDERGLYFLSVEYLPSNPLVDVSAAADGGCGVGVSANDADHRCVTTGRRLLQGASEFPGVLPLGEGATYAGGSARAGVAPCSLGDDFAVPSCPTYDHLSAGERRNVVDIAHDFESVLLLGGRPTCLLRA